MSTPRPPCDHKCHKVGLNPWVEVCPVCGCGNPKYDEAAEPPEELLRILGRME